MATSPRRSRAPRPPGVTKKRAKLVRLMGRALPLQTLADALNARAAQKGTLVFSKPKPTPRSLKRSALRLHVVGPTAADYVQWEAEAWKVVVGILTQGQGAQRAALIPSDAIRQFTALAAQVPMVLYGEEGAVEGKRNVWYGMRAVNPQDGRGNLVQFLWAHLFINTERDRLKKCPQCLTWFVDRTRNTKKERCSAACTDQWWNRSRRRAARHAQYERR